jgi:hypothetical protein
MTTGVDVLAKLSAPFPPEKVSWRVGSTTADKKRGMALAYIDARDVMQRLDDVMNPVWWQCRYSHTGTITICEIGIAFPRPNGTMEWVWKANGAGNSDVEAEKGACSDAFKRAAVLWGIGRYLYDLDSPWVALNGRQIAPEELPKLRALLEGNAAPDTKGKAGSRATFEAIQTKLREIQSPGRTVEELYEYWMSVRSDVASMPLDWRDIITSLKQEAKEYLSA